MSVTYSTNWMGPVSTHWYRERGLTRKVKEVLKKDQVFLPNGLKAGDTWEYDEITTHYCAGRIDIRDSSKEGYDGWDEYSLAPMTAISWNRLGDFLWDFETEYVMEYDELISVFESITGHKIEWWKEDDV